jgi:hypothetical protein
MRPNHLVRSAFRGVIAACLWQHVCLAQAAPTVAGNTSDVLRLLSVAKPGQVIALRPGSYSHLLISGFKGAATLTSLNPAQPAVLTDLTIKNSSGLTVKNLNLDNSANPMGPFGAEHTIPYEILGSENITLSHLDVHGSPSGSLLTDESGFLIRNSQHVTVEESDFHNLHNAIGQIDNEWLIIRDNHFHHLRDDGVDGGGSSNVLVEGNHCDSNHPDGIADQDHPDCIQFWTARTKQAAHDITIVNNTYERGDGTPTQGVFMRDDGGSLPYQRVTVSGNIIKGASYNGLTVFGAVDAKISGNIVCQYRDQPSWIVVRQVDGAQVDDNSSSRIAYVKSTRIKDSRNRVIADCTPSANQRRRGLPFPRLAGGSGR